MSEQDIKDMREDLEYFTSKDLKKEDPELYEDKEFRNYCKELLKASDEFLSLDETQKEYTKRYEAAKRKAFVLFFSKDKDKKLREYANEILINSGGDITPQQYDELQKKVFLSFSEKTKKGTEAAYKKLKNKEAFGELSEREEERLEELEAELSEEFIKKVEQEIEKML